MLVSHEVSIHILPEGRMKGDNKLAELAGWDVSIHILPEGRMKGRERLR